MSLRAKLIAECTELEPTFQFGTSTNFQHMPEAIYWKATVDGHHHTSAIRLKPESQLRDEEQHLRAALEELKSLKPPKPDEEHGPDSRPTPVPETMPAT